MTDRARGRPAWHKGYRKGAGGTIQNQCGEGEIGGQGTDQAERQSRKTGNPGKQDGGQRTEDGGRRTEDGRRRTEDGGRMTEDGGQRTDG